MASKKNSSGAGNAAGKAVSPGSEKKTRSRKAKTEAGLPPAPGAEELAVAADAGIIPGEDLPPAQAGSSLPAVDVAQPQSGRRTKKTRPPKKAAPEAAAAPAAGPRMLTGVSPRPMMAGNPYLPHLATVVEIIGETPNIRTLRVVLDDESAMSEFSFEPGQVGQLSVFGAGEATFVINSPPSQKNYLQFSVMAAGEVTDAIHRLDTGQKIGLRAPLGNYFPYHSWRGKNVFFIGGGIGMAPIRTIMLHLLEHREDYGRLSLLYGARSPRDMAYSYELDGWTHSDALDCHLCIDNPADDWGHKVGLIPNVLLELAPSPENCVAVLCGPPVMIKFTVQALEKLGFPAESIITTLERRMKCGIGICGRCNIGDRYVCVDGPVFSWKELKELPPEL